jgi:Mg2+-importing ATPase
MAGRGDVTAAWPLGQPSGDDDAATAGLYRLDPADAVALSALQVLRRLDAGPRGLTEADADRRLAVHGENLAEAEPGMSWRCAARVAVSDRYTAVIAVLAVVSAWAGAVLAAGVLAGLTLLSWSLRLAGERRAARAARSVRDLAYGTATVLRRMHPDAPPRPREMPVDQLVPGDIIRLSPGDLIAADLCLIKAAGLQIDQSMLTGESAPQHKYPATGIRGEGDQPSPRSPGGQGRQAGAGGLADRRGLCLAGSHVTAGSGVAVVVATGPDTCLAAGTGLPRRPRPGTAFERAATAVTGLLTRLTLTVLAIAVTVGSLFGSHRWPVLGFATAVAVGLTPEVLPVVVGVILAHGLRALGRAGVVGKRLSAVHDLGCIDVLCVDKTGTLTRDRLAPVLSVDADDRPDPKLLDLAAVHSLVCADLADPPYLDPFDDALLRPGTAEHDGPEQCDPHTCDHSTHGLRPHVRPQSASREGEEVRWLQVVSGIGAPAGVQVVPFDPVRRCTTVVLSGDSPGRHRLLVKGAVGAVLDRCTEISHGGRARALTADGRARIRAIAFRHARRGLRLLALAEADRPAVARPYGPQDEHGLTLLGFVGFADSPDPTAAAALAGVQAEGVALKIVTGDGAGTALRVCHDVGLDPGTVLTGHQIDAVDDLALTRLARTTTLFAEVTPAQKARIIRVLRAAGHTVGFLGDGANDAPALAAADIGIAPHNAVTAARAACDVLLTTPGLRSVLDTLQIARRSVANLVTYLRITLTCNVGNVIAMLVAGTTLPFLPMLSPQVLVQNVCFDLAQLCLAFDRSPSPDDHRSASLHIGKLTRFVLTFGTLNALADLATFLVLGRLGAHLPPRQAEALFQTGWFTENLITQAITVQLLRSGMRGWWTPRPILLANLGLVVVGLALPYSPLTSRLGFTALPQIYYCLLALIVAGYALMLVAARRRTIRRAGERLGLLGNQGAGAATGRLAPHQ